MFTIVLVAWLGCGVQYGLAASPLGVPRQPLGKVMTVATFNPTQSQLPEGIAIDKQGNIYVGFYPTGQIWKMTPDEGQSILATLDVGSSGGGPGWIRRGRRGDLYVCDASFEPATHGIWKVDRNGETRLIASLDPKGFPNALVFDEDGSLFVTDSYLGEIWKIPRSGEATVWFKSPLLDPTCCDGANGIAFDRGDMFVANTDLGLIVRIKMGEEDSAPHGDVFVTSPALVGAGGISFDVRHNLYVSVDYQNTVVRVSPDGNIETLATVNDGLDFPADTYFASRMGIGSSCSGPAAAGTL